MKILNFGSMNLDTVYQVPHFVWPGETLSADAVEVHPGGKGLNQSIALARAGAPVYHAGCLGVGGDALADLLRENGVNVDFLRPCTALQGSAMIQVTPTGENCILLYPGSNREVTEAQITETLAAFGPGDWLLLQNEINRIPEILEAASERGMKIVLNPSPCDEAMEKLDLSRVDWLIVNEVEAAQLTGSDDPLTVWGRLHARFPKLSLLLTLGEDGSVAFSGDMALRQAANPTPVADTTGAGDTYTGYFLAALTLGLPLAECMRRASCAAALSVSRRGAADSIPTKKQVDAALKRMK